MGIGILIVWSFFVFVLLNDYVIDYVIVKLLFFFFVIFIIIIILVVLWPFKFSMHYAKYL